MSSQQRYRWVDAALVRVATGGDGLRAAPWPDLNGAPGEPVEQWRAWLARVWAHEPFAEAVEVASPVLARQIEHARTGHDIPPRQLRRLVLSVAKYLLRMTGRATPFGLFAGVAPLRFGTETTAQLGEDHQVTARPDAVWLSNVVTRLEACTPLLRRLTVVANNLGFVRDDRLVVPCQPVNGTETDDPAEVSMRHTTAVETVVRAAQSPVGVEELAGKLAADHPATPAAVIEQMLAELVRRGVLITCLRPPMTVTDPLGHVLEQLAAVGADTTSEVSPIVRQLQTVHDDLARHNHSRSASIRRSLRSTAAERMSTISSAAERPLAVDLRLDYQIELPQQVLRQAQTAASLLARLTPYPTGPAALRDYHRRFVDRYGTGALVGVRDLVDADTGLGYPAGYRDSIADPPTPAVSERDLRLLALAQTAAVAGEQEVLLDEATVASLEVEPEPPVAPHTDLCVQVHASTRQALAAGDFDLLVVGAARAAGTMTGRFLHLLDPADHDRMAAAYRQLPTLDPDAQPTQLSCPPLYPRTGNVARAPSVQLPVISLAEYPMGNEGFMPLDDLAVGADTSRLYLVSLSSYRPVEPTMFQAVEFRNHVHPLARLLCEIANGHAAACTPFLWEAAARLPFLPRLRYGRIVLAAVRWRLPAADLPDHRAPWARWAQAVADWRHRFGVPDRVYLGEGDQRLRLDLAEPVHLALLRAHLDRTGHAIVDETPAPDAFGWLDGRPHEIVIPMAATTRQPERPTVPRPRSQADVVGRGHGHLPGASPWLSARLYAHPDRHATILTDHVPRLLSAWDRPVRWWFLRYRDPEPHLRLRLEVVDGYGQAAERVGAWATDVRRRGLASHLLLDTYYPEVGRYGTGEVLAAAEAVFAADSSAALAQIVATAGGSPSPRALCAASFIDLANAFAGSATDGLRWLVELVKRQATPALPRDLHDEAIRLAKPSDGGARLHALPGGERVAAAWAQRRTALASYRDLLVAAGQPDPTPVLASLLHMHHARVLGVEPDSEKTCHRLARAAALSWTARAAGAAP